MPNQNDAIQDALRKAQTPAGQQLLQLLLHSGGEQLRSAAEKAANGDCSQAQQLLEQLSGNPRIRELLDQLRR